MSEYGHVLGAHDGLESDRQRAVAGEFLKRVLDEQNER